MMSLPWPLGRGAKREKQRKEEAAASAAAELEEFGVTPHILNLVKGFSVDTFKNFPLQDDTVAEGDGYSSSGSNLNKDLSEWQERHAVLLLSKAKEISQIRYALCPRHMKDKQFWRIYFHLVKSCISPYEIRALQKAKLKKDLQKEKSSDKVAIEVEMMESKLACDSE